jgi:hypothetical protein
MRFRASYQKVSAGRTLAQRLAALEHDRKTKASVSGARFVPAKPRRHLAVCFKLGFASSFIPGGVAMLIIALVNGEDAHGNAPWLNSRAHAESPASPAREQDGFTLVAKQLLDRVEPTTIEALLLREAAPAGRQLWWKVPLVSRN